MQAGAQLDHRGSFVPVPPGSLFVSCVTLFLITTPLLETVCLYSLGWPLPSSCRNPEAGIPALPSQEVSVVFHC